MFSLQAIFYLLIYAIGFGGWLYYEIKKGRFK